MRNLDVTVSCNGETRISNLILINRWQSLLIDGRISMGPPPVDKDQNWVYMFTH